MLSKIYLYPLDDSSDSSLSSSLCHSLSLSFLLSAFLLIKFVRFLSDPNFLLYDMKDRAKQP